MIGYEIYGLSCHWKFSCYDIQPDTKFDIRLDNRLVEYPTKPISYYLDRTRARAIDESENEITYRALPMECRLKDELQV